MLYVSSVFCLIKYYLLNSKMFENTKLGILYCTFHKNNSFWKCYINVNVSSLIEILSYIISVYIEIIGFQY